MSGLIATMAAHHLHQNEVVLGSNLSIEFWPISASRDQLYGATVFYLRYATGKIDVGYRVTGNTTGTVYFQGYLTPTGGTINFATSRHVLSETIETETLGLTTYGHTAVAFSWVRFEAE